MKITIIGRSEMLYDTCELLLASGFEISCIVTSKEAPEYKKNADDFQNLANMLKVPFLKSTKLSKNIKILKETGSNIAVSVNFPAIIQQEIIDIFPLGILNAHGGDLPKYRGNACQAWALINGEKRIGLCIHKMIGGELDSGDIIQRDYLPVNIDTKISDVFIWMNQRIPLLFKKAIEKLSIQPQYVLEVQSSDPNDALRCYPRKTEDGLIDWSKSAIQILRLINASGPPYSGAFTTLEGKKITILEARLNDVIEKYCAVPGQITNINKTKGVFSVATGSTKLIIKHAFFDDTKVSVFEALSSTRQRLI